MLLALITGQNSLEPLLEGLLAQIHIDELTGFRPESNLGQTKPGKVRVRIRL